MSCSYCFEHESGYFPPKMPSKVALKAVDFLIENSRDSNFIEIVFIGGEPLLEFPLIREITEYATNRLQINGGKKQVRYVITTNGTLIEEQHMKFFRDSKCRLFLSIDGSQRDNDKDRIMTNGGSQFSIIKRKIALLKQYQQWLGARVTVLPNNARRLKHNIEVLHKELKINQFIIGFATGILWKDNEIIRYGIALKETFEYFLRERILSNNQMLKISLFDSIFDKTYGHDDTTVSWGCGAGNARIAITPNGDIYGCTKLAFSSESINKKYSVLGNVFLGFTNPDARNMLLNYSSTKRQKCKLCSLSAKCNGGCYAANITETGNMYIPSDYYCKLAFVQSEAIAYAKSRMKELKTHKYK